MQPSKRTMQAANTLNLLRQNTPRTPTHSYNDEQPAIRILPVSIICPAPENWNKYPLLKDIDPKGYNELKVSIMTDGVIDPIIVWHHNGKYIILSGHNRYDICLTLIEEYPEHADKWSKIKVDIYEENELTELEARSIIHQANIHRDSSKIPKRTKLEIIIDRIEIMEQKDIPKGMMSEEITKTLHISNAQYYQMRTIAFNLIPELKELFYDSVIGVPQSVELSKAHTKIQQHLADNYADTLDNKQYAKIKHIIADGRMSIDKKKELIDATLGQAEEKVIPKKKVTFTIEANRIEQTSAMVEQITKIPTNQLDKFMDEYSKFIQSFLSNNK